MKKENTPEKKLLFLAITLIALGVTFTTTLGNHIGSLGIVFIALGGLFFIASMKKKQVKPR